MPGFSEISQFENLLALRGNLSGIAAASLDKSVSLASLKTTTFCIDGPTIYYLCSCRTWARSHKALSGCLEEEPGIYRRLRKESWFQLLLARSDIGFSHFWHPSVYVPEIFLCSWWGKTEVSPVVLQNRIQNLSVSVPCGRKSVPLCWAFRKTKQAKPHHTNTFLSPLGPVSLLVK